MNAIVGTAFADRASNHCEHVHEYGFPLLVGSSKSGMPCSKSTLDGRAMESPREQKSQRFLNIEMNTPVFANNL